MWYYVGCDVSLKESFLSIINEEGKVIQEAFVATSCQEIGDYLRKTGFCFEKIGIESGQLSISLCKGLSKQGLPVICVDARHMAAALSARINKNDRNDARGIGQMMRAGLYKEVKIKSDDSCEQKVVLGSRRQLVTTRQQIMGTIRGLLKIYGISLGTQAKFFDKVRENIKGLEESVKISMEGLLSAIEGIDTALATLTGEVLSIVEKDEDCKRLMSVPGVGPITAVTYKAAIDEAERFEKSQVVGAYLGLTPRQYASGEVDRHGRISKMGPQECRTMLYEASQVFLLRTKGTSKLKKWGLKLMKKKGKKKAIVAVARKLAVIMHRMIVDKTEFCPA